MHLAYFLYLWTIVFQNAVKNCSLQSAAQEQRKVDENVKKLAEEHKVYNCSRFCYNNVKHSNNNRKLCKNISEAKGEAPEENYSAGDSNRC